MNRVCRNLEGEYYVVLYDSLTMPPMTALTASYLQSHTADPSFVSSLSTVAFLARADLQPWAIALLCLVGRVTWIRESRLVVCSYRKQHLSLPRTAFTCLLTA